MLSITLMQGFPQIDLTKTLVGVADFGTLKKLSSLELGVLGALIMGSLPFFAITQSRPRTIIGGVNTTFIVTLAAGLVFISVESLWLMFISFEFLLLSAIYMLLLTSKSERSRDAALEMFIWTLIGSAGLLTGLGLIGGASVTSTIPHKWGFVTAICFLLGFGVKVPLWPATSWLLKAHVEASVEFSILLSGFIVKIGVLGLHRTMLLAEEPTINLVAASLAFIGLLDATFRLPAQRDLKRIVALTTVIEMNWAVLALGLGGSQQVSVAAYLCLAHCCTTTTEFFLVEILTKRFNTRDIAYIGGIAMSAPLIWIASLLGLLITIGFPGTSLFWAKYVFFTGLIPTVPSLGIILGVIFLIVLPIFFIRLWSMVWFGNRGGARLINDLASRELLILGVSIGLGFILGLTPGILFWLLG
jgi:NADH-quinone oxidoreductase subunit M